MKEDNDFLRRIYDALNNAAGGGAFTLQSATGKRPESFSFATGLASLDRKKRYKHHFGCDVPLWIDSEHPNRVILICDIALDSNLQLPANRPSCADSQPVLGTLDGKDCVEVAEQGSGKASMKEERIIFYVNEDYSNEVTLNKTMDEDIDSFGSLTWRELITEVLGDEIPPPTCSTGEVAGNCDPDDEELDGGSDEDPLMRLYGITRDQLDDEIDEASIDRYYSQIEFHPNNRVGPCADAFNFLRGRELFEMDADGNGSSHGVTLHQSTSNGPRKSVHIDDREAAEWLIAQLASKGCIAEVAFI